MPLSFPLRRQDHSYLLQAFRFFVRNNFLLDFANGAPLQLPPPPAYPPAAAPAWGRLPGSDVSAAEDAAEGQEQQQQGLQQQDVAALLASVAKDAIDVELSDEEMEEGLLLPAVGAALVHPAAAGDGEAGGSGSGSGSEEEEEEQEEEDSGSSGEEDLSAGEDAAMDEGEEEQEDGQLAGGGAAGGAAEVPHVDYEAAIADEAATQDAEDCIEFS